MKFADGTSPKGLKVGRRYNIMRLVSNTGSAGLKGQKVDERESKAELNRKGRVIDEYPAF